MAKESVVVEEFNQVPSDETCDEIAEFLAAFVRSGQLAAPMPGDDRVEVWRKRLNWWWHENPYVDAEQPLAYLLRTDEGKVVGFHGFIPHDYVANGRRVPTLITTTFFVDEAHRGHSMKIVLKLNRLGRDYQLLDGTPSPEMRAILDKFQFEKRDELNRYNLSVKRGGLRYLKSHLLRAAGFAKAIKDQSLENLRLIHSPDEIVSIPDRQDELLRRAVTIPGLQWSSRVGNGERQFFGLIDAKGILRAFAIGLLKQEKGVTACRMLEYGAFDEDDQSLCQLMSYLANHPKSAGLDDSVDVVLWSVFEGTLKTLPDFEPEVRESLLYFKNPKELKDAPKQCLPCEGDLVML